MSTIMHRSFYENWHGMKLPLHIAYLYHNGGYHCGGEEWKWQVMTYAEIFKRKTEKIKDNIRRKRLHQVVKPGYVLVFHNNTNFYCGWYLYIKTLKTDFSLTFRCNDDTLMLKVMRLYPCGILPMKENFDNWAKAFSRRYPHKGFKRTKNQGLLKCSCQLDEYGRLVDINVTKKASSR